VTPKGHQSDVFDLVAWCIVPVVFGLLLIFALWLMTTNAMLDRER
jgi:hypothetical protein